MINGIFMEMSKQIVLICLHKVYNDKLKKLYNVIDVLMKNCFF